MGLEFYKSVSKLTDVALPLPLLNFKINKDGTITKQDDLNEIEFSFLLQGNKFDVFITKEPDCFTLMIQTIVGYIPFTAESASHRDSTLKKIEQIIPAIEHRFFIGDRNSLYIAWEAKKIPRVTAIELLSSVTEALYKHLPLINFIRKSISSEDVVVPS